MAKSLFEAYKNRLAVANTVYAKAHNGESMSNHKKLVTAKVLENTNRMLNESMANGATQLETNPMNLYKKFALNLTTVALPNLIAHDLVIVSPMSSMSGYITYVEYSYGSNKNADKEDKLISNPFRFGETDVDYTGVKVVETIAEGQKELAWGPVVGAVEKFDGATWVAVEGEYTPVAGDKVRYTYDNVVIPQKNLPTVKAEIKSIALVAKARRIAVYYSQMAAFQMKTDYGVDLGDQLAEKAVGELSYEIDCEVIEKLYTIGMENGGVRENLTFSKTQPVGVSKRDHYAAFAEVIEIAKQIVYDATQKFAPNWMVCSSSVIPVLSMIDSFKAAPTGAINGPYMAGTFGSLKVFVSPRMNPGEYMIGVNGGDMMSAAAVYAPYMAIVPTQLLQYADGGNSQGFSTLYALEKLNENLVIVGKVID